MNCVPAPADGISRHLSWTSALLPPGRSGLLASSTNEKSPVYSVGWEELTGLNKRRLYIPVALIRSK